MMTTSPQQRIVESRYHRALHKLVFRLLLIVSISGMAQILSHYLAR